ncbi:zinc-dependent peptidase [Bizionia sp. KMM 8389]
MVYLVVKMVETGYFLITRKLLYRYIIPPYKKLEQAQRHILETQFIFYQNLPEKEKRVFTHRLSRFIASKEFIGRDNLVLTDEMIVLTSATAVMLTFGFQNYSLKMIQHVIIYPSVFYSETNKSFHKGEFNPRIKSLVLSWEHFVHGYQITNDNLNLGIHEFAHAIHITSIKNKDTSSLIFADSFKELTNFLSENEALRSRLIESDYIRPYAYENMYEFVAVIIETFIETPTEFRAQFPEVYKKTKQMLNFNFIDY